MMILLGDLCLLGGKSGLSLPVHIPIPRPQLRHVFRRDLVGCADLQRHPHRARHVLHHHRRLDCRLSSRPDGEHAVVLQQYRRGFSYRLHHQPADLLPADQRKARTGDRPAKLICLRGEIHRDGAPTAAKAVA